MTEKQYNQKRACALAGINPRVYRRVSKRSTDIDLRDRLKELSSERRRFGYRRLHILQVRPVPMAIRQPSRVHYLSCLAGLAQLL